MKRVLFALMATAAIASATGCCCGNGGYLFRPWGCQSGCGSCGGGCASGGCGAGGCSTCGNDGGYANNQGHNGAYDDGLVDAYGSRQPVARGCAACARLGHTCSKCLAGHKRKPYPARNSAGQSDFDPGPPTGAVAYPYYTTRGPRDFLAKNPPSIGP